MAEGSGSTRADGAADTGATATRPGRPGAGTTRAGATGTALDAAVAGGALLLALYGAMVIMVDLVLGTILVPASGFAVAGIMVGCLVVGGVVGGVVASRSDR